MVVGATDETRNIQFMGVNVHDFVDWDAQQTSFEGLTALSQGNVNLSTDDRRPQRYTGAFVSANFFDVLRVQPALGRGFLEEENRPGADPVIVIGYDVWQEQFDGSPDVLGRTVRANSQHRTVVGVAPQGFMFPDREQLWLPMEIDPNATVRGEGPRFIVIARLLDGRSQEEASAEMAMVTARLQQEYPETNAGIGASVRTFNSLMIGGQASTLLHTMLGAALGVLIVACANVANLLLARASTRTREVAVRTALGAVRRRVISQLMTEVLVLAAIGGAVGLLLGHLGLQWFNRIIEVEPPPFFMTFGPDYRVALFIIAMVVFAAAFSGLVPALRATGGNTSAALKDEGRGSSSFRLGKFSTGLVIAEVTLSCGLLIVAGLMIKSVVNLKTRDLPFTVENIFTARLRLPADDYPDTASRVRFYEEFLPRIAAIPGVQAATLSDGLPATGNGSRVFEVEGQSYATDEDYPLAREGIVTPGYFDTFETPIFQGRAFTVMDIHESLPVAVVNETFVRTFFPEGDPLGRRIRMGRRDTTAHWLTVVGVVPDMLMEGMANPEASPAGFYIPISQSGVGTFVSIAARVQGPPMAITPHVRDAVISMDANLPIYEVLSMNDAIAKETWFYWIFGSLFMVFGIMALFLAAVGLFRIMSFAVSRRTQEIGIRMALGASSPRLIRLVMSRAAIQLVIGIVLGIGLAAVAANPLQFILYEVDVRDPFVFGSVVGALALTGLVASFVPATRVTRVDPVEALTAE
jgi:predicted permease